MEVHVVVSAAKGKSKAKRSRQLNVGDKLEYLRSELDSLPSSFPLEESEEPEEHLTSELDRLPSVFSREEPEEPEEPKEPEEPEEPARKLDDLTDGEVSKSKTVEAWHQDLLHNLKNVSTPPKVTNSTFRDARKLFGVNCEKKVTLRNPGDQGAYEEIVLLQFDPNFMSTEVVCCHPSCNDINPAAAKCGKRDLYLCPHHQQVLRNSISDALAKKSVQNSTSAEKPEPGQFAGYTSLISLLEGAYHDAKKFHTLKEKSPMVQEAILNVRNFLIITSTVLNPDEDNLGIALPPVVQILKLILENPAAFERVEASLIHLLQEVIKMILFAFGVIYTWVSLALGNPGAKILAGVCGIVGGLSSGLIGVAVGLTFGGLFGDGMYCMYSLLGKDQRQQEYDQLREYWRNVSGAGPNWQPHKNCQYRVYYFNGDARGGLDLQPFPAI